MIETITSLKISGRCFPAGTKLKCFCKDESRISIIYGKNGSGKSTLAKALCNLESDLSCLLLDKNDNTLPISKEHLYVFNEDYYSLPKIANKTNTHKPTFPLKKKELLQLQAAVPLIMLYYFFLQLLRN